MSVGPSVEIVEVGPRDGLQNEPGFLPTSGKIALVDALSGVGFRRIEVASFVSPKWVPQMADSAEVLAGIQRAAGVAYTALTPNVRGVEAAVAARSDAVAIFGSASEGFSRANINASISESLDRFRPVMDIARAHDLPVRGYVSCVVECPYDGAVPPGNVARVAAALWDMGCHEISLGDTLGKARPEEIRAMLKVVKDVVPVEALAGHYHDTAGRALENIEASYEMGIRVFDAAVGGLGGCPYAPGAAGNVATESVAAHFAKHEIETGLDLDLLQRAAGQALDLRAGEMAHD